MVSRERENRSRERDAEEARRSPSSRDLHISLAFAWYQLDEKALQRPTFRQRNQFDPAISAQTLPEHKRARELFYLIRRTLQMTNKDGLQTSKGQAPATILKLRSFAAIDHKQLMAKVYDLCCRIMALRRYSAAAPKN